MNKIIKKGLALALVFTLFVTSTVLADSIRKNIEVTYNNIKVTLDGTELSMKDSLGTSVEPFIYNGTTYLPVRAVAEAVGKDVTWDNKTQTVILGDNYGELGAWIEDLEAYGSNGVLVSKWTSADKDKFGKTYTHGACWNLNKLYVIDKEDEYSTNYYLEGKYRKLKGSLISYMHNAWEDETTVCKIYLDGELAYTSPVVDKETLPIEIDLDLDNAQVMKIVFEGGTSFKFGMVDAGLYK